MSDIKEDIKKEDIKGSGHAAIQLFEEKIRQSDNQLQYAQGKKTSLLHAIEGLRKCKMSDKKEDGKGTSIELLQKELTGIQNLIQVWQKNKKEYLEAIEDIRKNC